MIHNRRRSHFHNTYASNEYLKQNPALRKKLKIFGFIILLTGIVFIIIGFRDVFGNHNSQSNLWDIPNNFGTPKLIWMIFVGLFLTFIGGACLSYGYMGQVARYTASEMAPVATDTANYILDGTKDQIIDITQGIQGNRVKYCPNCGDKIDTDEIYCDKCGKKLIVTCKKCGMNNEADSAFCKKCGDKL